MAKKIQTPEEELAAYRKARSSGGCKRRDRMTSSQRAQSARYARSFGVGGTRRNPDAAQEASAIADRILASVKPQRKASA